MSSCCHIAPSAWPRRQPLPTHKYLQHIKNIQNLGLLWRHASYLGPQGQMYDIPHIECEVAMYWLDVSIGYWNYIKRYSWLDGCFDMVD